MEDTLDEQFNSHHDRYQDLLLSDTFDTSDANDKSSSPRHIIDQQHHQDSTLSFANINNNTNSYATFQSIGHIYSILDDSINSTKNLYQWLCSFSDPRVEQWPMMSSPIPTLGAFFLYLIVANYGPTLMKQRKPFKLNWLLVIYNLYVAMLNLWIVCELCYCAYKLRYRSLCQLVLITNDPYVIRIANGVWWYYASKGIEFADTLFFILRKKDRQLTFLHKYHHSTMFLVWWTAVKFVPGGSAIIPIVVNSFVHVLMYAYYGLSALGLEIQRYLWWKRYLTIVQLVQFFVGVAIGIHLITSGCQFTRWMQYVFSGYAFSFIILFGNFYLHEYINGRQQGQKQQSLENKEKKL